MQIDVNAVLNAYKEEIAKIINDNVLLKAQVMQLQHELEVINQNKEKRE